MSKNKYFFAHNNPRLQKKMESEHFKLSEQILDLKYQIDLSFEKLTKELNITVEEFVDMEYGEDHISIEKYEDVISRLNKLANNRYDALT